MIPTCPIAPATVRYIKLGAGGSFARSSLDKGELQLGYHEVPHDLCAAGDWNGVLTYFSGFRKTIGKASDSTREIQDWWGFAEPEVTWLGIDHNLSASRKRRMIGGWRNTNIHGEPLRINDLTTRLTQVANYQGTICAVRAQDYLLRRINGADEPVLKSATAARAAMLASAQDMITGLHWADFEIMVDLIFARGGWQRVSVLGKTMADVDLVIEQPTLGETASVQVKSKASQAVLDGHIAYFTASGHARTFFVCHTPTGALSTCDAPGVHLWTGEPLAGIAVKSGLFEWLMDRVG